MMFMKWKDFGEKKNKQTCLLTLLLLVIIIDHWWTLLWICLQKFFFRIEKKKIKWKRWAKERKTSKKKIQFFFVDFITVHCCCLFTSSLSKHHHFISYTHWELYTRTMKMFFFLSYTIQSNQHIALLYGNVLSHHIMATMMIFTNLLNIKDLSFIFVFFHPICKIYIIIIIMRKKTKCFVLKKKKCPSFSFQTFYSVKEKKQRNSL